MNPFAFVTRSLLANLVALIVTATMSLSAVAAETVTPDASIADESAALGAAIEPLITAAIEQGDLPGAVVVIGRRDQMLWQHAYGHRQLEPTAEPMTLDTVFDLASLTKPVATATSVMILAERGKIKLSDPVAKHLPQFASKGKDQVTIEQLLLHIGGMIPDNSMSAYADGPEQAITNLMNLSLNYPPGSKFRYSDVGFQVLGELVRSKTGMGIDQFAKEQIFQPLGMEETGYLPAGPLRERAAPTEQRDGQWMRGEVHDPRAYATGGVAGHAGLFSTAADLVRYARMMLGGGQLDQQRILTAESVRQMTDGYPVPGGQRGLGWDKRTGYSTNRGETMTDAAFGHGGFTGTAMWIDPELDLFVIFLSNRLHPDGQGSVNVLAGQIGTIAADLIRETQKVADESEATSPQSVRCGIDVLAANDFQTLAGARVGLITNHTGVDGEGTLTSVRLADAPQVDLVALFSPEHGFVGALDQAEIGDIVDPVTGVKVHSLYGKTRRPTKEMLDGVDVLVFDIQDIGTRFYTYIATMGEAMSAAQEHGIRFVVLDRPNPIGGIEIAGPVLPAGEESFVGYHTLPLRHGMTVGELAMMFQAELYPELQLEVIDCQGWQRADLYDATGLYWINPSPNMRNLNQAILYPGVGVLEYTNISVGRGTDTPFEHVGAPWIDAGKCAADLNAMKLGGVRFVPERFTPTSSVYEGQECEGVQILIVDRSAVKPVEVGLAIALVLRKNHPQDWEMKSLMKLLSSQSVFDQIAAGEPLANIVASYQADLEAFAKRREKFLRYP